MAKLLDSRVKDFAKPASSVKHSEKIVRTIPHSEITILNSEIAPKIDQNKRVLRASFEEARNKVIKD